MSCIDIFEKVIEREDVKDIPITFVIRVVMVCFEEIMNTETEVFEDI